VYICCVSVTTDYSELCVCVLSAVKLQGFVAEFGHNQSTDKRVIFMSDCLSISVCLSVCLSVHVPMSVCMFVCLSMCICRYQTVRVSQLYCS